MKKINNQVNLLIIYRKGLQTKLIDKNEHESLCNHLLSILIKQKKNLF